MYKKMAFKRGVIMRLWHYDLLPYLPDAQFKGQLRELVAIMRDWRDKGATNHLLINKVMEYPKNDLVKYFIRYECVYHNRYNKWLTDTCKEFLEFDDKSAQTKGCFDGWHNKEYLLVCMANLYEKHFFGVGNSRITDEEWERLIKGYRIITGEEYKI
jgi:uncharacterized protein (TIGR02328 family)